MQSENEQVPWFFNNQVGYSSWRQAFMLMMWTVLLMWSFSLLKTQVCCMFNKGKSVWLAKRFFSVSRISGKARLKTGKCNIFCSWGMDADLKSAKIRGQSCKTPYVAALVKKWFGANVSSYRMLKFEAETFKDYSTFCATWKPVRLMISLPLMDSKLPQPSVGIRSKYVPHPVISLQLCGVPAAFNMILLGGCWSLVLKVAVFVRALGVVSGK